ncbi:restriction endonuclease subunit S [Enterococcus faecium]|nr:restriction endonuclease subunit S [Enterococcus faecium]
MSNDTQPEIRFPGFTDDWEERKLGEVVVFLNGRAFKQQELLDSGKYRVLRVGNFNTNDRWYYSNLELEEDKYANKGDLLYLWATSFGPEIWNEERVIYHYHIWKLKFLSKELDKQYLYTWLLTDKEKIKESTNGTTMVHVTKGGIEQRTFQFPPDINEQQKIGAFFKQLDDTIALHQRKLDLLKETKKGFLQKMFPKNGAKVPEIRFPGFTEDWEQRKFKEFSKKTGKKNTKDLDFPAYSVSNKAGLISQTEQFDGSRLDDLEKTNYKFVEPNEFAYNPARVNVGSIAFNNLGMTVIVSSLYVVVKMSEDLDNEFILQFIKSPTFIKEVKRNTEGSVREYLFYENFANIKFPFTRNKEEQQKIGAFFKQLDDTIALHQRKLDLLKETKKGFLQKMFV